MPTPAVHGGQRTLAGAVEVSYRSSNISEFSIAAMHTWDGNRVLLRDYLVERSGTTFAGGLSDVTVERERLPDPRAVLTRSLGNGEGFFGIGVSLLISANSAKADHLEIRGVGVELLLEDRT